jgi:hypothetical protein
MSSDEEKETPFFKYHHLKSIQEVSSFEKLKVMNTNSFIFIAR